MSNNDAAGVVVFCSFVTGLGYIAEGDKTLHFVY